jgi:hypothetical protein
MPGIIINNLIKDKTVASQCSPLDSTIFGELQQAASLSHSHDSGQNLLFDMLTLSHFIGPRVSECAQTTQENIDYHVYPSETCVIKAFTANNFIFYDKNGHILKKINNSTLDTATSVQIIWRIHKNRQNGQKIKLSAGTKNPALCPVRGALQMIMRATCLGQPDNMPSSTAIYYQHQDCYTHPRSSKESTAIHFVRQPQKILCPFPPCLGLCAP